MNQSTSHTAEQVKAALSFSITLAQAIRAAGPQGIPSGHLYAAVMGKCELPFYTRAVQFLKDQGIVAESNHVLTSLV